MTVIPWQLPTDKVPTEHEEQRDFVRWYRQTFRDERIFAIPNGGRRQKSDAAKLKVEGVSRGVPDLMLPGHMLFIEMKKQKDGTVSPEQKEWIAYLRSRGFRCEVCKGSKAAQEIVKGIER